MNQQERALALKVTGWEFDTIIQSLEATIDNTEDRRFEHDVRNLILELAGQLNQHMLDQHLEEVDHDD